MKTVGEFKLNETSGNQVLELFSGINISWSEYGQRTSPPVDRPPCGFTGELCPTPSPSKCLVWLFWSVWLVWLVWPVFSFLNVRIFFFVSSSNFCSFFYSFHLAKLFQFLPSERSFKANYLQSRCHSCCCSFVSYRSWYGAVTLLYQVKKNSADKVVRS